MAGRQHDGRSAGPGRVGEEAAATTAPTAPGGGTRRPPRRPTTWGPPTSRASFPPETASGASSSISDQHTRYLLSCRALPDTKTQGARPVFERTFREFGLPRAIRTDNGVPFTTRGLQVLGRLNVRWLRLGILHQRIRPTSPQENGAHERMHPR